MPDLFVTFGGRSSLLDTVRGAMSVLGMGVLAGRPDNAAAFARRGGVVGPALELTAARGEIAAAMTAVLGNSCCAAAMTAAGAELSPLDITEPGDSV